MTTLCEAAEAIEVRALRHRVQQLEGEREELRGELRSRELELAHVYRELQEAQQSELRLKAALLRHAA